MNDDRLKSPGAIVGIGASAGGLESLERFFGSVGDNMDAAFIVVQHLSPNHETMMDSLLARHTTMPVRIARDNEAIRSRNVYVIPPKKELTLDEQCRIQLHDQKRDKLPNTPIDRFFTSLSAHRDIKLAAVILSGTGSDGSRGIVDVHNAGGLVMVESEATAKFSGMPNSAAATGIVQLTLPADSMAIQLAKRFQMDRPTTILAML